MPRRHQLHFYDASEPRNVPSGVYAAVYVSQPDVAWPQAEVDRMRGVFGISESGEAGYAHRARCIAVEDGAAQPLDVVGFLQIRREHYGDRGMVYCDRSIWPTVEQVTIDHGLAPDWWIAAPDIQDPGSLRSEHHGTIPVAVQNIWRPGFDLSVVLGVLHFTLPHHFNATGG